MVSTSRRPGTGRFPWLALGLLAATANAQLQQANDLASFKWGFKNLPSTTVDLPECGRIQIFVNTSGGTTAPVPPYTFIAYEAGGIPTAQNLGSDLSNLMWTVDHAEQSQLVLSMTDGAGNSGGIPPSLYTVTSGLGSGCHSGYPTSPVFSLTTNATKSLASCDYLTFKMTGGKKPYTISVAALSSPIMINVTLGNDSDTLDWVNRAAPNVQIIASVSDADGVYAGSTNLITTFGSSDLTCDNLQSTESDSTAQSSGNQTSSSSNHSSSHKSSFSTTLIAIIAGGASAFVLAALALFCCFRRRKANARRPGRYAAVDTNNEFGLGGVRGASPGETDRYGIAAEMTPISMRGGLRTAYTDDPRYHGSIYSQAPSEMTLEAPMQVAPATYSAAPNVSPGASPYIVRRNVTPLSMVSSTASSFDPYGRGSIAPSSPLESTSTSMAGHPVDAAYAAYAGSVTDSDVRTGEAGPSTRVLAVANVATRDEKQGPVPPAGPRESVIQHEDISDVVELPPAYKERTDL